MPLRKTESIVLLVSHGGIISVLQRYLLGHNYGFPGSLFLGTKNKWEVKNCSITEITLSGDKGPGEIIRMGDWDHVLKGMTSTDTEKDQRLENSTG
jgi:broad specificity phosphatase PhoE